MHLTTRHILFLSIIASLFLLTAVTAGADDVLRFRGNNAESLYTDKHFNPNALASGAKIIWQTEVKQGFSSVAIKGARLYTMGNDRRNDADRPACRAHVDPPV